MSRTLAELCNPSDVRNRTVATNTAKQAMQEIILCVLDSNGFFDKAVFHGGTCLRILHGLDRFSEDLDFTLLQENMDFDFSAYAERIIRTFENMGLEAHNSPRPPKGELQVFSDKIIVNLCELFSACGFGDAIVDDTHSRKNCVVKIDIDLCPPNYAKSEIIEKKSPLTYSVRTEPLQVLFAGKISAILCRPWENRVKGRDMYDFRWYIERDIPVDLLCLQSRMRKKCDQDIEIDRDTLIELLDRKFDALNWRLALYDIENFVSPDKIGEWGSEPFKELASRIKVLEN